MLLRLMFLKLKWVNWCLVLVRMVFCLCRVVVCGVCMIGEVMVMYWILMVCIRLVLWVFMFGLIFIE